MSIGTHLKRIKTIAFLTILCSGCSSLGEDSVPPLGRRSLTVSKDKPGVYYQYCLKKKFLSKECKEQQVDFYDFNDPKTRERLRDMGYRLIPPGYPQ